MRSLSTLVQGLTSLSCQLSWLLGSGEGFISGGPRLPHEFVWAWPLDQLWPFPDQARIECPESLGLDLAPDHGCRSLTLAGVPGSPKARLASGARRLGHVSLFRASFSLAGWWHLVLSLLLHLSISSPASAMLALQCGGLESPGVPFPGLSRCLT